jgi:bacteriocin-like protein
MERITESKFNVLNETELAKISGGLPTWKVEKTFTSCNGTEYTQVYNWWGHHATGDLD